MAFVSWEKPEVLEGCWVLIKVYGPVPSELNLPSVDLSSCFWEAPSVLPRASYIVCWSGKMKKGGIPCSKIIKDVNMVTGDHSTKRRVYVTKGGCHGEPVCAASAMASPKWGGKSTLKLLIWACSRTHRLWGQFYKCGQYSTMSTEIRTQFYLQRMGVIQKLGNKLISLKQVKFKHLLFQEILLLDFPEARVVL